MLRNNAAINARRARLIAGLLISWLLFGWALTKMAGWCSLVGDLMLSGFFGLVIALGLLTKYRREAKGKGARCRWWVVVVLVFISLAAADMARQYLMSVRLTVAYGGPGGRAVILLDNDVVLVADVDPAMQAVYGKNVVQEPFSHSVLLGVPVVKWGVSDFEARSLGWGKVEISVPGVKIKYWKNRLVVVNGQSIPIPMGFWNKELLGSVETINITAGGSVRAVSG